jgi:hypothetical protein
LVRAALTMFKHVYWTLLIGTCLYALWRGQREERLASLICLVATVATIGFARPHATRYFQVERSDLLVDLAVLLLFVAIALRSPRFWPLWIAGLQLTTTGAHLAKEASTGLLPPVYAAAERIWSYPILIILLVAVWRGHRRAALS